MPRHLHLTGPTRIFAVFNDAGLPRVLSRAARAASSFKEPDDFQLSNEPDPFSSSLLLRRSLSRTALAASSSNEPDPSALQQNSSRGIVFQRT